MTPELQLEPLIEPSAVSQWPAYGWWLLLALIVTLTAVIGWWLWRRWRWHRPFKQAAQLLQQHPPEQREALCQHCNALLKRTCHQIDSSALTLHGQNWQRFLQQRGMPERSSEALAFGGYNPQLAQQIDAPTLVADCRRWLLSQRPGGRHV